jgi:hypothetical protein
MKFKLLFIVAVTGLLFAGNSYAGGFGLNVDYNKFKDADKGDWGVGARGVFGGPLAFIASFDYYFVNDNFRDTKFYEVNGNLAYTFPTEAVRPYIGGGVGIARRSFKTDLLDISNSKVGFNVLGGLKFGYGRVNPFAEVRYVIYQKDQNFKNRWVITGGILF